MRETCKSGSMSGVWKRSMVALVRHRQTKGAETDRPDLSHRATSRLYLSGKRFAEAVRNHWSIENSLHWVLDVTFGEDQSRTRNRRMADNLSWLRRFAVSLLKCHPAKESIRGKSRMAGWNNEFLMEVLMAQGV